MTDPMNRQDPHQVAWDFACDLDLGSIRQVFNDAGPWRWELRDSAWYGEYLNVRPGADLRLRIHRYPFSGSAGVFGGLRDSGFSALLQAEQGSPKPGRDVIAAFRKLLDRIEATGITDIEPYD